MKRIQKQGLKITNTWTKYLAFGGLVFLCSFPGKADKFWAKILMEEIPQKCNPPRNPISVYCGNNCKNCGLSQNQCISEAQSQLKALCSPTEDTKENCYLLWLTLTETCKELCVFE